MIAIIVSTADSLVNTGAIVFSHDILPQKISEDKKIKALKSITVLSGMLALSFACFFPGVLEIILFVLEYYFVIIAVPFIGGLFIKKTKKEPFWASVLVGSFTFIVLHLVYRNLSHEIFIISMFMSLISYVITFILVNKTAIKAPSFSINKLCDKIIEKHAVQKTYLGWIILLSLVLSIIFRENYYEQNNEFIFIETIAGFLGFILLFVDKISKKYSSTITLFIIWYCLSFLPVYMFLHQKSADFFTTNFVISLVLLVGLFSWNIFLPILLSGSFLATLIFCLIHDLSNFLAPLMYLCLLISYVAMIAYIFFRKREFGMLEFIRNHLKAENRIEKINEAQETLKVLKRSLVAEKTYQNILLHEDKTMEVSFEDLKANILEYFRCLEIEQKVNLNISSNRHKKLNTKMPLNIFYKVIYSLTFTMLRCAIDENISLKFFCEKGDQLKRIEFTFENSTLPGRLDYFKKFQAELPENILNWTIIEKLFEELEMQIVKSNRKLVIKYPSQNSYEENNDVISFKDLLETKSKKS